MSETANRWVVQAYQDALDSATSTLTRQALPAIRSGAALAGQYGGSPSRWAP